MSEEVEMAARTKVSEPAKIVIDHAFEQVAPRAIIEKLLEMYAPDLRLGDCHISDGLIVTVNFNHVPLSEAFKTIAEAFGVRCTIGEDGTVAFVTQAEEGGPA